MTKNEQPHERNLRRLSVGLTLAAIIAPGAIIGYNGWQKQKEDMAAADRAKAETLNRTASSRAAVICRNLFAISDIDAKHSRYIMSPALTAQGTARYSSEPTGKLANATGETTWYSIQTRKKVVAPKSDDCTAGTLHAPREISVNETPVMLTVSKARASRDCPQELLDQSATSWYANGGIGLSDVLPTDKVLQTARRNAAALAPLAKQC